MSKLKRAIFLFPIFLIVALAAKADTAQVYVNGSYAFANNGYGIGPYGGTLNGQAASFYCVDFAHDIVGQTGWTATPTYFLNVSTLSTNATLQNNAAFYAEMAWMLTQMMGTTNQTLEAEYQWTIWSLTGAANNPYAAASAGIISSAQYYVNNGWSAAGWEILTPVSGTGYPNQPGYYGQEFMVLATPEPSSTILLLAGLTVLGFLAIRK